MNYNNWDKWYTKICNDFGFKECDDIKSAKRLNDLISKTSKFNIQDVDIKDKTIIFGAGPSLKLHIDYIKNSLNLDEYTLITADGATTALLEEDIVPDIIVTDLDGKISDIIKANNDKSILYVHAHGDNQDKIDEYVPVLKNVIPTCQCEKFGLLENYGGFTDGDRAVHIAYYGLGINDITLAGMDYGSVITRYSRPGSNKDVSKADDFKKLKLEYAKKLVDSLKKENSQLIIRNLCDTISWSRAC